MEHTQTDLPTLAPAETAASSRTIPFSDVPGYPAFLQELSTVDGLLLADPLERLRSLRDLERFTPEARRTLADAVGADLAAWGAPAGAVASAVLLAEPDVYAVVTGQQAGIAGGPLYTFHKAIGAVRAASELARLHPEHRFVPVFWIEADDHDFEEVRGVAVLDRAGVPATARYDDGDARPLHVGDRAVNAAGLGALADALGELLPATEFGREALRAFVDAYSGARTLADGFARYLYALLGDTNLVLVNSRNAALKGLAADVFAREAAAPEALFAALTESTGRLAGMGIPTPIEPRPGALFLTHDGERRALEVLAGGGYAIKGTDVRMTFEEAAALARTAPERFSPKVALRPIVQDAILPTALYLGGPSEISYLRQVRDAYALFDVPVPAVGPRPFVMFTEPKVRRVMESVGIDLKGLLAERFDAAALLVDQGEQEAIEAARDRALARIAEAGAEFEPLAAAIDPTLTKALGAATAGATKGMEDMARRLAAALRKKQQTEIDRVNAARTFLLPGGVLQERSLSAIFFIARFGAERFGTALNAIAADVPGVQVIPI